MSKGSLGWSWGPERAGWSRGRGGGWRDGRGMAHQANPPAVLAAGAKAERRALGAAQTRRALHSVVMNYFLMELALAPVTAGLALLAADFSAAPRLGHSRAPFSRALTKPQRPGVNPRSLPRFCDGLSLTLTKPQKRIGNPVSAEVL